ncbi:ribonuclease H-like domain-containing protein [Tanacetum coccineum]
MSSLKALIKQYNERSGTQIEPIRLSFGEKEENDKEKNTDKETGDTKTKTFRNHLKSSRNKLRIEHGTPRLNYWKKTNECYPEENYPQGLFTKEDVRGRTTVMTSTSTEITTSRMKEILKRRNSSTDSPGPLRVETPMAELEFVLEIRKVLASSPGKEECKGRRQRETTMVKVKVINDDTSSYGWTIRERLKSNRLGGREDEDVNLMITFVTNPRMDDYIELEVSFENEGLCQRTMMKFIVVQHASNTAIIPGPTGGWSIQFSKPQVGQEARGGDEVMTRHHNLWDIIFNGDLIEEAAPAGEQSDPPAPKTAKQLTAKRNQERVKSILILAIPDEYLLKFHNVPDAKSLWVVIESRFGGNNESKKMQKNVLKHQFENFTTASNESLDKAYDRFQKLISKLEVHGALVSKEDINQKFLRSLPPSLSQIALIMRNKPDIDEIDIDDLYNNLRVYEYEMKSTNEVSTASGDFVASIAGGTSQVSSTPCADEVMCSFFAQQTTSPQLENEDLQQIDEDDLEELDLRWQVAMLTVRCYNCHRKGHFARECKSSSNQGKRSYGDNSRRNAPTSESSSQALVAQDGLGGYDWSNDFDVEPVNYALMAISSSCSSSSSDNEVQNCSKQCLESFKTLQKNFDSEREKHNRARLEIQGYEFALESLESRIIGHEKNELAWGEKYEFQNYELECRELKINKLTMELENVVKERDEMKVKIEKWEESSKSLNKLLNSQMSANDTNGLGYGT